MFNLTGQKWLRNRLGQEALTLGPFVTFYSDEDPNPCTVLHEEYHAKDQRRYGYLLWYALYLLDGLRVVLTTRRARDNFFEHEAYRISDECERRRYVEELRRE